MFGRPGFGCLFIVWPPCVAGLHSPRSPVSPRGQGTSSAETTLSIVSPSASSGLEQSPPSQLIRGASGSGSAPTFESGASVTTQSNPSHPESLLESPNGESVPESPIVPQSGV